MMHIVVQAVMVLVVASAVDANSLHQMRSMVRQAQLKVKAGCPTTQSMSTNYVHTKNVISTSTTFTIRYWTLAKGFASSHSYWQWLLVVSSQ